MTLAFVLSLVCAATARSRAESLDAHTSDITDSYSSPMVDCAFATFLSGSSYVPGALCLQSSEFRVAKDAA